MRRKRDGDELDAADISSFIAALAAVQLSEGQIGAFAIAVWFKGMSRAEIVALTLAMADSGNRLQLTDIDRPIADKHSIGASISETLSPTPPVE
ncbi:thymidine phosphorylase, partial [Rhizobium ruizarguesonis]